MKYLTTLFILLMLSINANATELNSDPFENGFYGDYHLTETAATLPADKIDENNQLGFDWPYADNQIDSNTIIKTPTNTNDFASGFSFPYGY